MQHAVPDLALDGDACPPRLVDEGHHVVELHLARAEVNEERREPVELRVRRGRERVLPVPVAEVHRGEVLHPLARHDRVEQRTLRVRGAAPLEVDPRREERGSRGERLAGVAQRHERRQREAAAGRVSGEDEARRPPGRPQQSARRGEGVKEPRRERVLGREPVVERERDAAERARDAARVRTVAGGRAERVATAVKVEERPARVGACRDEPLGRDPPTTMGSAATSGRAGSIATMASTYARTPSRVRCAGRCLSRYARTESISALAMTNSRARTR